MTTTIRLAPPKLRAVKAPVTARELAKAVRVLDVVAAPVRTKRAPQLRSEDVAALQKLSKQHGAVTDVDVQALAATMSKKAATNLERLFAAVTKLRAQGELSSAWTASTVDDAALAQLASGALSPRVARHVQRVARNEVLTLSDAVRDRALRKLVVGDLKSAFHVEELAIKGAEIPVDLTLRERNARMQNALLAILFDAGAPLDLVRAAVVKLGSCGDKTALPTLRSLAKAKPEVAADVKKATERIEKAAKMTIVFASMEVAPYAFAGGLGNVMAELPKALAAMGHRVVVISPRHTIIDRNKLVDTGKRLRIGDEPANILSDVKDGVEHYFVENGKYYSDGRYGLYGDEHGDYHDVAERYDFFSRSIGECIKAVLGEEKPDVIQLNDAHTGPAAAYLKRDDAFAKSKVVMAIHNLGGAYQGRFRKELGFRAMGLMEPMGPAEWYGGVNFLKLGLVESDASIAVSREYAKEILESKNGEGLEGVLRVLDAEGRLWGNLNGIDTKSWDPKTDRALPANYSFADMRGKAACKAALQRAHGLPERATTPVVGLVSRITDQKGIDDAVAMIERRCSSGEDVQFVVCGVGDAKLCAQLVDLARRYPDRVAYDGKFTKDKERKIIAGSDLFLMPSRFEPCGLPQMYAMRYLTVPVVRAVGGLNESVTSENGFKSLDVDAALADALDWYRSGDRSLLRNLALADFSWETTSAKEQVAFFRKVVDA